MSWDWIASLIDTERIIYFDPFAYLKITLEVIAPGHPQRRINHHTSTFNVHLVRVLR